MAGERLARKMAVERKTALESAAQLRQPGFPAAVRREHSEVLLIEPPCDTFERDRRERRRRLSQGEPRMNAALQQRHATPSQGEQTGKNRAREPRTDDGDVVAGHPGSSSVNKIVLCRSRNGRAPGTNPSD